MNLFIPFHKVDAESRTVYGMATGEQRDLTDEVCDYASTAPLYRAWSEKMFAASGGKSRGNVRAMHGKSAAGKVTDISYDDVGKRITIAAKIVDDGEWNKVVEGVYTGFSQGGKYIKRWPDPETGFTRYTAEPHEVSLVDMPCLPGATFEMIKAAGKAETVLVKNVVAEPDAAAVHAKAVELAKGGDPKAFTAQAVEELLRAARATIAKDKMTAEATAGDDGDEANPAAPDDHDSSNNDEDKTVDEGAITTAGNGGGASVAVAVPAGKKTPGDASRKWFEPEHRWIPEDYAGPHFATKAEAVKFMKARDEAERTNPPSPLTAALAELEKKAGIAPPADAPDPLMIVVERLFPSVAKRTFSADERKAAAKDKTAMPDGSFPIITKEDLSNAIHAFGRAKDKAAARAHIETRARALGCSDMLPDTWATKSADAAGDLAKGMYGVADFAQTIASMANAYQSALQERAYEGDSSTVPDDLCHVLRAAGEVLVRMVAEEIGELMPDGAEPTLAQAEAMANAAGLSRAGAEALVKLSTAGEPFKPLGKFDAWLGDIVKTISADLDKIGARHSKGDQQKLQAIHDHSMSLGACCSADNCGNKAVDGGDLLKAANARIEALEKDAKEAIPRFETIVKTLVEKNEAAEKRLANLEAQPAPAKARVTVVGKGTLASDSEGPSDAELLAKWNAMSPQEQGLTLMKGSLAHPIPMGPRS